MKHLKFFGRGLLLAVIFALASIMSMAQPIDPGEPPDPSCDPLDPKCPIDDYYGVFIFAIILVAAYKAYKRRAILIQSRV